MDRILRRLLRRSSLEDVVISQPRHHEFARGQSPDPANRRSVVRVPPSAPAVASIRRAGAAWWMDRARKRAINMCSPTLARAAFDCVPPAPTEDGSIRIGAATDRRNHSRAAPLKARAPIVPAAQLRWRTFPNPSAGPQSISGLLRRDSSAEPSRDIACRMASSTGIREAIIAVSFRAGVT